MKGRTIWADVCGEFRALILGEKDNMINRPLGKERILGIERILESEAVRVKRRRKGKRGDWRVVNGGR